jgi:hypothetical protein
MAVITAIREVGPARSAPFDDGDGPRNPGSPPPDATGQYTGPSF